MSKKAIPAAPGRPKHAALSAADGLVRAPKDFQWLQRSIPCQVACPAGTDIPGYLEAIARGAFEEAYRINLRDNVFPTVLGRVCTRPCEPVCRHGWEGLGEPVAICFSKRSAADALARKEPVVLDKLFPSTGRRVAVVGAGVAGLSAARDLALFGHAVTVFEGHTEPGGMMVQGIPPYRLPRALVAREIDQIRVLGVDIRCGERVDRSRLDVLVAGHDAVVVAAGTTVPNRPALPGADAAGVWHGLDFLRSVHRGAPPDVGRRVLVIGGGFTAVDCARTARRLGAEEVTVVYRRRVEDMYITPGELEEMAHEGIGFQAQASPEAIASQDGRAVSVQFIRTRPGPREAGGRMSFDPVPGSSFEAAADTVLLATGQVADRSWLPETLPAQVRITGDYAAGARSLIDAIADGRRCAREVDELLMGTARLRDAVRIENAASTGRTRELDAIPRQPMPALPPAARARETEVELGYEVEAAKKEASRCYLCHYKFEIDNELCIYCDRCLKVKPVDGCIVKVRELVYDGEGRITGCHQSKGPRDYNLLYIDQSKCIRCGACRDVCPVACIDLQRVSACIVPAAGRV